MFFGAAVIATGTQRRVMRRNPNLARIACGSTESCVLVVATVGTADPNDSTRIHGMARPAWGENLSWHIQQASEAICGVSGERRVLPPAGSR